MRTRALMLLCAFTILASTWLAIMFLILHHGGFVRGFTVSLLFVVQSAATIAALYRGGVGPAARAALAGGALAIAAFGAWSVFENNTAGNTHYEGYADLIGSALTVQGLWTVAEMIWMRGRPR